MTRRGPLRRGWRRVRERLLDGLGQLYTGRYYVKSDAKKEGSSWAVAESLLARYRPHRVVDIGCGSGVFLAALAERGVEVLGLERSRAGLALCHRRGVPTVPFDLRCDPLPASARGDLCLCFEVAEHLDPCWADRLAATVAAVAPRLIFTAAPPGQGGVGHFNEQPPGYWTQKLADEGMTLDGDETAVLRAAWDEAGVVAWLVANVMVFERTDDAAAGRRSSSTATES